MRKRIAKIPKAPGVYRWLNEEGDILYVGKAVDLRARLKNYVAPDAGRQGPWKESMMRVATDVDVTIVRSELEALLLETNLIKQYRPKYNVLMKDDKNYVYAKFSVQEKYPHVEVVRKVERDGAKYFGPYLSSYEIKKILDMLHLLYNFRACEASLNLLNRYPDGVPAGKLRPCTDYHIGQCNGLCAGAVTHAQYIDAINHCIAFFKGDHEPVIRRATEMMQVAAKEKKFEKAATLRNALLFIEAMREKQIISDPSGDDVDVFGVALLSGKVQVVLFQERGGKLLHEAHFSLSGSAESKGDVLAQFLPQYYSSVDEIPPVILVGEDFSDRETLAELLKTERGKNVKIIVPERGKKSHLLELAEKNAEEKAKQAEAKWETEHRTIETALEELQALLSLPSKPKRIEGYDISHLGGTETAGSMSVFCDGKPNTKLYRHFTIQGLKKGDIDDYKSVKEVLRRRMRHLVGGLAFDLKKAEEAGITFGKARKDETGKIETIIRENAATLAQTHVDYKDFMVAREGESIVAIARIVTHPTKLLELKSVWVSPEERHHHLGHLIVRKILSTVKKGKIYITLYPRLESFYSEIGFRHVLTPPKIIKDIMDAADREEPDTPPAVCMLYDTAEHKRDPSLEALPDLLMIDGGKGQLGVAVEVLKEYGLSIPVIGLAKREEEIFVPGNPVSLNIPKESQGRYMLMRLRDEAHRFANRLREMKAKNTLLNG